MDLNEIMELKNIHMNYLKYRWTSLYRRERDSKNMLEYNEFAYKKTNNHCKLEDRFQKKRPFFNPIYENSQIKRPHITRATCIVNYLYF